MTSQRQPVYLVATHRSGANLLRSILGGHPEVSAPAPFEETSPYTILPELNLTQQRKFIRDLLICQKYCPHGLHEKMSPAAIHERMDVWSFYELQRAIYEEYAKQQGSSVWITKFNGYQFNQVGDGVEFYDNLKIIYFVRDARDVALSLKSTSVGPYHPYLSAGRWTIEQSVGKNLLEDSEVDIYLVKYEDLLQNPNDEIQSMCDFLGVDVVNEMLSYHEREDTEQMAGSSHMFENISKPIMADNFGKFRDQLSDEEIGIVERVAQEPLDYFGYELVHSEDEVKEIHLHSREVYEEKDAELRKRFKKHMWRNDTKEMIGLRMWAKYKRFLYLRYSLLSYFLQSSVFRPL